MMPAKPNLSYEYQAGAALLPDAPCYVVRQADQDLYNALKAGKFCYILNSRQMGKSSLRGRTMGRLQGEGVACAFIDVTAIGSEGVTLAQWYAGIIRNLVNSFNLQINLRSWLCDRDYLPPVQRLGEFIEQVLLAQIPQNIVIFIDEIDHILNLDFKGDDFFAQIRACYNQRANNPKYQRLTFALLGVATPSDLIKDKNYTPFNIGQAIELHGFRLYEVQPLAKGLEGKADNPQSVLKGVLDWTGGQPFLTQKLCQLVRESPVSIAAGREAELIEQLVRTRVLKNWESQDEPVHLKTIRDRVLSNEQRADRLLELYEQILQKGEMATDASPEQVELRLSGLVVQQQGKLMPYNRIYKSVFDQSWVDKVLADLRPDAETIKEAEAIKERLYDQIRDWVRRESPKQMIENFRCLFIEGRGYKDSEVQSGLEKLVNSNHGEEEFPLFLNRCCYIVINHWHRQSKLKPAIPELVALFENLPPPESTSSPTSRRLRHLVINFTETEQYLKLQGLAGKRLEGVTSQKTEPNQKNTETEQALKRQGLAEKRLGGVTSQKTEPNQKNKVGNLIIRYPYLYEHCLLSENSSDKQQRTVREKQAQMERRFEVDLSQYAAYKVRQAQTARNPQLSTEATPTIPSVKNPTLLKGSEVGIALKQFGGKVEGGYTYGDVAQNFLEHSAETPTYQAFKDDLYLYLISSINPKYGKHKFNDKLYKKLQSTLSKYDSQKPSEFLLRHTCSQLFNFLVVESPQNPKHYVFMDLMTNLRASYTIGLLLKLVLLCPIIKPYLEKRFSILFNHYKSFTREGVPWLIKALENLHIAFSVNFGRLNWSYLKQIM
ncbi:MAG: AAA-like domain-containing protein [Xenococcaceae cyanobacterium]